MTADAVTQAAQALDTRVAEAGPPTTGLPTMAKPNPIRQLTDQFRRAYELIHCQGKTYAVPKPVDFPVDQARTFHGVAGVAQPFGTALRLKIVRLASMLPGVPLISRATADTVMLQLEAHAFEAAETPLALRFVDLRDEAAVALDLGREDGLVATIRPDGWTLGPTPPGVVFRRSHATKPLPVPERGGRLDELAGVLALDPADETFRALLGWVVGLPFVASVRPGLALVGPKGTGKSTRIRLAASLVEPSGVEALGALFGRKFADDQVRALHRAVPLWDNLTSVSGDASDSLCCLVTGTARETRSLYTDNDLNTAPVARPVGLTAVGVPAGLRPDALDRLIVLDVPPVAERLDDDEVQKRFDLAHAGMLGALCDAVSAVLRWRDKIDPPTEYRMAAHARVLSALDAATSAGELDGVPAGMLAAYAAAYQETAERTVAEDTFGGPLLALLEARGGQWQGKASELLAEASVFAAWNDRNAPGWPSSARRVPEVLNHLRDGMGLLGLRWTTTTVRGSTRYVFQIGPEKPTP